ncbi:MAG: hypothetical protein ACPHP2_14435, partial [Limisphaerales bacterium]
MVHYFETGPRHDHLTARLEHGRGIRLSKRLESERNTTDGAQVRRDVIAGNTIAAGGTYCDANIECDGFSSCELDPIDCNDAEKPWRCKGVT